MEKITILRSTQVFDSLSSEPKPLDIVLRGSKIADILPYGTANEKLPEWTGDTASENIPESAEGKASQKGFECEGKITARKIPACIEENEYDLIDYGDKLIIPSFMDAHTHIFSGAISSSEYVCDTLGECHSKEEVAAMIGKYAAEHSDLKRIRGTGWFLGAWDDDALPNKKILDAVISDRSVYLQNADGHSFWLNSKAIEEAGIVPVPDLSNGIVETDEDGNLTGMLIEPAAFVPAMEKYMDFSMDELVEINRNFQKTLAANGICAMSEMFAEDYTSETYQTYDILKNQDEAGEMCSQVYIYTKLFGYTDFTPWFKMRDHFNSPHVHINGVKGFIDGVTETYTGLLLEPYTDRLDTCGENLPLWPQEKMQEEIIAANKAGIQVRLHCIADGSVRMALDMYDKSRKITPDTDFMNTIEHIENIHPDDIGRFRTIGVIPSMQPYHVTLSNCDKVVRLGVDRCKYEWPIRSIYEAGGTIALGTDFPVVTCDPFETIYAAATRCDQKGRRMCMNVEEQTLPMDVILKAYTAGAAEVYQAQDHMGTIEKGKDANILVLSRNLFQIPPAEILKTEVEVNYFEGRKVFER